MKFARKTSSGRGRKVIWRAQTKVTVQRASETRETGCVSHYPQPNPVLAIGRDPQISQIVLSKTIGSLGIGWQGNINFRVGNKCIPALVKDVNALGRTEANGAARDEWLHPTRWKPTPSRPAFYVAGTLITQQSFVICSRPQRLPQAGFNPHATVRSKPWGYACSRVARKELPERTILSC